MTASGRLLAIGLDGFEISLAERFMTEGRMPNLARLRSRSARFRLDHGPAKYSGLTWEHVSTGRTPEMLARHSAVVFDPDTYHVRQEPTHEAPIFAHFESRTVLFDVPYCDLHRASNLKGIARWGAHDPGAPQSSNPATLADEIAERFGPYPAARHIYAMVWQSAELTAKAGAALAQAVDTRARAAEWVLTERIPDWQFALVVVSEPHSAIEPMWHGVDPHHPLHAVASAAPARAGLEAVYGAVDALIGRLTAAFPETSIAVFAMHGMGDNGTDLPAMALLPELLYRRQFKRPWMRDLPWSHALADGTPLLAEAEDWHRAMRARVPTLGSEAVKDHLASAGRAPLAEEGIDWQPTSRYRPFWPDMDAFAMPSFYDGRVRVNVIGRERLGRIAPESHHQFVEELKALLLECVDPITSRPVVAGFSQPSGGPYEVGPTESDLYIYWAGLATGLAHPELGRIGPIPFRRTGGHSGPFGFLYCASPSWPAGDLGDASSFDVMRTLIDLLGERLDGVELAGRSLAPVLRSADRAG